MIIKLEWSFTWATFLQPKWSSSAAQLPTGRSSQ